MTSAPDARVAAWLASLDARHRGAMRPAEFYKAVRALSARYVERRADLPGRSPLDSAGKRSAFAGFYAPLHFLTVARVVDALGVHHAPADDAVDLGCGTGAAGAAWALARARAASSPRVLGVDRDVWALEEAKWNWRALGVAGRVKRTTVTVDRASRLVIAAWCVNELSPEDRDAVLRRFVAQAARGGGILILEPIARRAAPWWDSWVAALHPHGARADEWDFAADLPEALAEISEAAGFNRDRLTARSLYVAAHPPVLR